MQAIHSIGGLYEVERHAKEMSDEDRWRLRQETAVPIAEKLHEWMLAQRALVPEGSATAKALDYSLKRWVALTRYLEDGAVPIDNNQIENLIRPWALGRSNWLFAGSLRSGKRAAAIMSLIQSSRINGHDPYAYLKDVLMRLPTRRTLNIEQLLPHQWTPVRFFSAGPNGCRRAISRDVRFIQSLCPRPPGACQAAWDTVVRGMLVSVD